MDKRTVLAIVLSLAVLVIYQIFFFKPPVPQKTEHKQTQDQPIADRQIAEAPAALPAAKPAATPEKPEAPPRDIEVETPLYSAVFSTQGAALKSLRLKKYYKDCQNCPGDLWPKIKGLFSGVTPAATKTKDFVELVNVRDGMPYPLALTFPESGVEISPNAVYETSADKLNIISTNDKQKLVFSKTTGGIKIEKVFTFEPTGYTTTLEVKVHNLSASPVTQIPELNWYECADPNAAGSRFAHNGPIISLGGSIERQEVKKIVSESIRGPNVMWGAFESKYFIAAAIPENPSLTNVTMNRDAQNMVTIGIKGHKELIPSGQSGVFAYSLYLGPKQYDILKSIGVGLENSIDYGWFWWLAIPFLYILNFLKGFVLNYGIAIIILTTIVKIIFWPLGNLSYKSMNAMKELQPKIEALKDKYKGDQAKIGQETMALYRQHKVNPFAGCLPMLIQIPVFFGLYKTLMYSIELRHSPFFFWIQDLSANDPFYITPIIMGASQFLSQKMTPAMGDPMQQKIMLLMPVIFTFFFLNFPAGLVIYWLWNNILQIGQQYYINKKMAK
ncbi:MAG: membrane protein insertase YidC [Syntrophaceae bacterium]|nr:membrane protein insertase YidC [Syntrophaceae bacterium]HOE78865.1 membrane protein insertase YidC [Smithellaceae bacterium]HPL97970.1 membrane protein insertase YidC [Smithellaceae bacterium]HQF85346.1 membrane protein insertase YidC [Smithellaceae bacterium]HQG80723.1 membrane protein insertase YidC [Smithellaceae bacterium]